MRCPLVRAGGSTFTATIVRGGIAFPSRATIGCKSNRLVTGPSGSSPKNNCGVAPSYSISNLLKWRRKSFPSSSGIPSMSNTSAFPRASVTAWVTFWSTTPRDGVFWPFTITTDGLPQVTSGIPIFATSAGETTDTAAPVSITAVTSSPLQSPSLVISWCRSIRKRGMSSAVPLCSDALFSPVLSVPTGVDLPFELGPGLTDLTFSRGELEQLLSTCPTLSQLKQIGFPSGLRPFDRLMDDLGLLPPPPRFFLQHCDICLQLFQYDHHLFCKNRFVYCGSYTCVHKVQISRRKRVE